MKQRNRAIQLVLTVLVAALAACSGGSESTGAGVEDIKSAGKLRIATFGDLPPYGYVENNGTRAGFDISIGNALADKLGVTPEWVQVNADSRVDALKSDKVDLVLANFTVTPERQQVVDFATPYMKVAIGVASPVDAPITDIAQLAGKQVAVNKGTTAEAYFTENHPEIQLVKFDSKTQQFQAFKDHRVAALADDNSYLFAWTRDNPNFAVAIKEIGPRSFIAPAVKLGNTDLADWVGEQISALAENGTLAQFFVTDLQPYFTADITPEDILIQNGDLPQE